MRPRQQLAWSFSNVAAAQSECKLHNPANAGFVVSKQFAYVCIEDSQTGAYIHRCVCMLQRLCMLRVVVGSRTYVYVCACVLYGCA